MDQRQLVKVSVLMCVLSVFTQASAQKVEKTPQANQQTPVSQVSTNANQALACSVSSLSDARSHKRCGDLSSTSVTSLGVHVEVTGGPALNCTSMSLANGDSINSCLTNGISVVQICKQEAIAAPEKMQRTSDAAKQNVENKTAFQCEVFLNGEKQIQ